LTVRAILAAAAAILLPPLAQAQSPAPRTISDILAILEQEKPDAAVTERKQREAQAEPPAAATEQQLAEFYFHRAEARNDLDRHEQAVADLDRAIEQLARHRQSMTDRSPQAEVKLLRREYDFKMFRLIQHNSVYLNQPKRALALVVEMLREFDRPETLDFMPVMLRMAVQNSVALGDAEQAKAFAARMDEIKTRLGTRMSNPGVALRFENNQHLIRANEAVHRGQPAAAATEYDQVAETDFRTIDSGQFVVPRNHRLVAANNFLGIAGYHLALDGRLAEGEAKVRQALLAQLRLVGRYNQTVVLNMMRLADILRDENRAEEAEALARIGLETYRALGVPETSPQYVGGLRVLGSAQGYQKRFDEQKKRYDDIVRLTADWLPGARETLIYSPARLAALYRLGQIEECVQIARDGVAAYARRFGDKHPETALVRGYLAAGLAKLGRDQEALREFAEAMPVLTAPTGREMQPTSGRFGQTRIVIESFIDLLTRVWTPIEKASAVEQAFGYAELLRGTAVQSAIAASTARMTIDDAELAGLARREQDLRKLIAARLNALNAVLALPPAERDDKAEAALRQELPRLQAEQGAMLEDLARRFPNYAGLISPRPPSVAQLRAALKPGEAFLSIYSGNDRTYVWVFRQDGAVEFASVPLGTDALRKKVGKLREALEPNVATIDDIPAFDTALAHELYELLLKPVEAGWKPAHTIIVAANGALGMLPLSLLVTRDFKPGPEMTPFGEYRAAAWLARTHAVVSVPSAATFRLLRTLPVGSADRRALIGFGDPVFSREQLAEAAPSTPATMRGVPLRLRSAPKIGSAHSATLAALPRLPDTREELTAVASVMKVDPKAVLHLGPAANVQAVEAARLSDYRVVMFATHGLVAGELDGLTQPALALSAPEVAHVPGDGLLTAEGVLSLKLDADWVVLSACNTGLGVDAAAEAASGLGRAFFYAGSRSLLVTNWPVHSASARELVSGLFRRQSEAPSLSRAEALRRTELALIDGPGFTDDTGKPMFSYAHPLFWAPYSVIGDGG
jgi:CHAT domain-containing protein